MQLRRRSGAEPMRASLGTRAAGWAVPLLAEAAALLRSALMARVIGGDELGRALVLTLVLRLAEMLADVGVERLLMQRRGVVTGEFLAALHGALLVRGVLTALSLLLLAWPSAWLMAGGASAACYAALALVPFVRGFAHLAPRLAERELRMGPMAVVEGGAVAAMLLALPVVLWVLPDHRAILVLLVVQAGAQVVLSHAVAREAWRVRLDRGVLAEVMGFGAPLVANAFLMFLTFQADRLVVAGFFGWAEVAVYGVAFQLAMLPAQIAGRAAGSLLAPRLRGGVGLARIVRQSFGLHLAAAAAFACGFALLAPPVIGLVWGAAFRPELALALALGVAAGARILRTPLSQLAVALGRTGDPARANLLRAAALLPALAVAVMGGPLVAVAAAAAAGEIAATFRAMHLSRDVLFFSRHEALA